MEQHAVPQHISSYKFRLVGDMTLKQFFQVAGGALIGLLLYASPLPNLVKWPLIIFFVLAGAAMAFLPFEERPIEQWVLAFFKSIYQPTLFYWKKSDPNVKYYQDEAVAVPATGAAPAPIEPETEQPQAPRPVSPHETRLEQAEQSFLSKFTRIASGGLIKPKTPSVQNTPPVPPEHAQPEKPEGKVTIDSSQSVPQQPKGSVQVPEAAPTEVEKVDKTKIQTAPAGDFKTENVGQTLQHGSTHPSQVTQFSTEAAPPNPPSSSNTVVGQVMDSQGKIIEGAILEIKDSLGRPVRAIKTNKAGHFWIATPLADGKYELVTEKEDFMFEPMSIEVTGTIVPPIAVRAKERTQEDAKPA